MSFFRAICPMGSPAIIGESSRESSRRKNWRLSSVRAQRRMARSLVARIPTTASALLTRSDLRNWSAGEDGVEIGEDFGRAKVLFAGETIGHDLAAWIDNDEAGNAVAGISAERRHHRQLLIIDRRPRHVGFAQVSFETELVAIVTNKNDFELGMLRGDTIVIIDQLRGELAARAAPMRGEIERDQFLFLERFVVKPGDAAVMPVDQIAFD